MIHSKSSLLLPPIIFHKHIPEGSASDLTSLGATPEILSLEDAPVQDLTSLLTKHSPDAIIFSAGAGGKGDKSRTRKVDYEGAVKVFDAAESANVKRVLVVGAIDVRDRKSGYPDYYNDESSECLLS